MNKTKFYQHLRLFAVFNGLLLLWNFMIGPIHWLIIPMMAWCVALISHVFLIGCAITFNSFKRKRIKAKSDHFQMDIDAHLKLKEYWAIRENDQIYDQSDLV